jgi:hypothetical protein
LIKTGGTQASRKLQTTLQVRADFGNRQWKHHKQHVLWLEQAQLHSALALHDSNASDCSPGPGGALPASSPGNQSTV